MPMYHSPAASCLVAGICTNSWGRARCALILSTWMSADCPFQPPPLGALASSWRISSQIAGQNFAMWHAAGEGSCAFLMPTLVCMQIEGDEVAQRLLLTRLETQRLRSQIEVLQEQQQALDQLRRSQEQVGGLLAVLLCACKAASSCSPVRYACTAASARHAGWAASVCQCFGQARLLRMCASGRGAWPDNCWGRKAW